ncbi:MAG: sensor histidine kinase [Bacteroidota bacterium]
MNLHSLSKYVKPLLLGAIATVLIVSLLAGIGFVRINFSSWLENLGIFTFWWLFFSLLIYKIPYFRKNKKVVYNMLGLLLLLLVATIIDSLWGIPDNPITFPLIIIFWLGLAYLVLPRFFQKYKIAILSVYAVLFSYFLVFRMRADYFESHQENVVSFLLVPIPVLIGLWFYEQWRWLRSLQADKAKAELALLKSQINPHFFFNTLNNLYGLAVEKSDQAPAVILTLSEMMRYTIYEGKEEWVPLKKEIVYLENYIELHRIRYQNQVDIRFDIQGSNDWQVAPLLFIILLENAFKHGAESLTEGAYIHMSLHSSKEELVFAIENNFDQSQNMKAEGIGLINLNKRLHHIYPKQHELLLEEHSSVYTARLSIRSS